MLYSKTLVFIHSVYKSLRLLTPTSSSIPPHPPPPWQPTVCFLYPWFSFCFTDRFICHALDFTYKWYGICLSDLPHLWLSSIPLYTCTILFIHSSDNGYLGCFYVLATVNSAIMNMGVHVPFWILVLPEYIPKSETAWLHGNSIFHFPRHLHIKQY